MSIHLTAVGQRVLSSSLVLLGWYQGGQCYGWGFLPRFAGAPVPPLHIGHLEGSLRLRIQEGRSHCQALLLKWAPDPKATPTSSG